MEMIDSAELVQEQDHLIEDSHRDVYAVLALHVRGHGHGRGYENAHVNDHEISRDCGNGADKLGRSLVQPPFQVSQLPPHEASSNQPRLLDDKREEVI
jgi:hypothetical protein